jgi:hypothetical protein
MSNFTAQYENLGVRKLRSMVPGGYRMSRDELVAYLAARDMEAAPVEVDETAVAALIVKLDVALAAAAAQADDDSADDSADDSEYDTVTVVTNPEPGVTQVDTFATPSGRGGPGKPRPHKVQFYCAGDPNPHVGNFTTREAAEKLFTKAVEKGTHTAWSFLTASE